MWLFAVFLAWPLIEIGLFVTLGGWLGLWLTLAVIFATAMLGIAVLRMQGVKTAQLRGQMGRMRAMAAPMARQAVSVFAAVLLILPGFLTDAVGLILLLPPVQAALIAVLASRFRMPPFGGNTKRREDIIDGEFIEVERDDPTRPPSGWTRD